MRRTTSRVLAGAIAGLFCFQVAFAQSEPNPGSANIEAKMIVEANGDAKINLVLDLAAKDYTNLKGAFPNPHQFLRDLSPDRVDYEVAPDSVCSYDDAKTAVRISMTGMGAAKNHGDGDWSIDIDRGPDFINSTPGPDGRMTFYFFTTGDVSGGLQMKGQMHVTLPAGATDAKYDTNEHVIRYRLPKPEAAGTGRVKVNFKAKDRLMTCTYKIYGLGHDFDQFAAQWVAKSVIKNTGEGMITDLRVRYRMEGYAEWSMWEKFPELVPGQTVVSVYYPVIDKRIAEIRTNTPANLMMEYRYTDSTGKEREDSDGKRLVLLGVNEFVFSNLLAGENYGSWGESHNNAPLLAAWVARNDPVIKEFAAMANKNSGGVGASTDDKSAIAVLKACYEIMLINDFTYQHPPGIVDKSTSFDPKFVQNIKMPRDVIRDKSGTCIDLAILYASMVNSIGLKPYLMVVPGHCFPVVQLPGGGYVGVEATGVGGGLRAGASSFDDMLKAGVEELNKYTNDGRFVLVDCQELWTRGVSNPELEALPPDILNRWGISPTGPGGGGGGMQQGGGQPQGGGGGQPMPTPGPGPMPNPGPGPAPGPGPGPVPAPGPGGNPAAFLVGSWQGTATEQMGDGSVLNYPIYVEMEQNAQGGLNIMVKAEASVMTEMGMITIGIEEFLVGAWQNNTLMYQGQWKRMTLSNTGQTQNVTPDSGQAVLQGATLVGTIGNAEAGYSRFTLVKAQ